jgi:hypothetical protein
MHPHPKTVLIVAFRGASTGNVTVVTGKTNTAPSGYPKDMSTSLLTHYSGYFRYLLHLQDDPRPQPNDTIRLIEEDPRMTLALFDFLNHGLIYDNFDSDLDICKVFVFGENFRIPELCNAAIDLLFQRIAAEGTVSKEVVGYVYKSPRPRTMLKKFLIDEFLMNSHGHRDDPSLANAAAYPKEFVDEVRAKQNSQHDRGFDQDGFVNFMKERLCSYHDHSEPALCKPVVVGTPSGHKGESSSPLRWILYTKCRNM